MSMRTRVCAYASKRANRMIYTSRENIIWQWLTRDFFRLSRWRITPQKKCACSFIIQKGAEIVGQINSFHTIETHAIRSFSFCSSIFLRIFFYLFFFFFSWRIRFSLHSVSFANTPPTTFAGCCWYSSNQFRECQWMNLQQQHTSCKRIHTSLISQNEAWKPNKAWKPKQKKSERANE